jgi:hypothetical protein
MENRKAISLLQRGDLPSQIVAILRQELDSMIRVIYLLSVSDKNHRAKLIQASAEGKYWTQAGTRKRITDRDMLELANKLQGWAESVYRFGCGFIHLSSFHDYRERDPMETISSEEKESVLRYMRYYHGGPLAPNPTFKDLIPYLPMVFEKISANLECYLKDLEHGKSLHEED